METAIQYAFWLVGIVVGVLTIGGATARVVHELANMEKAIALLQRDVEHLNAGILKLEKILEAPPRSH